jgi:hypothetical protein
LAAAFARAPEGGNDLEGGRDLEDSGADGHRKGGASEGLAGV